MPTTGISPRFEALIGMLSGKYRLSKRSVQEMCGDVFDVDIALGSVCNAEQLVSASIAEPVAEAHEAVKAAAVVHADETGWREAKQKAWLWVATTATIAVFVVIPNVLPLKCASAAKEADAGCHEWVGSVARA